MDAVTDATIGEIVAHAAAVLQDKSDSPRLDAEVLLAHCLDRPRSHLLAHSGDAPAADTARRFEKLIKKRATGTPIAYLVGAREFWSLPLLVTADTLVPRPETERLVELALERLSIDRQTRVADLGTGSGAVALALASERPLADIVATDLSADALAIAQDNANRLGLGHVEFLHGDWFAPLAGRHFDLIVSNPPYVAEGDPHLDQGDVAHEPRLALLAGSDGLDAIRTITANAPEFLQPGGALLVEHGSTHGEAVRALLRASGFVDVDTKKDLSGWSRVTGGRYETSNKPS